MPPTIRLATPDDAARVQAVYAPYCFTPISFELQPPGIEEMRRRMVKVLDCFPWLVCVHDDDVLGYAYASTHSERAAYCWSVNTSVYVRQGLQRRGVGRALYTTLLTQLPLQHVVNAYAGITLPNPGSVGLHAAMGFRPVGVYEQVGFKYQAWHDVLWMQLALVRPRPSEPQPLRSLAEVRDLPAWQAAMCAGQPYLK